MVTMTPQRQAYCNITGDTAGSYSKDEWQNIDCVMNCIEHGWDKEALLFMEKFGWINLDGTLQDLYNELKFELEVRK